jgi:hypothetical protein
MKPLRDIMNNIRRLEQLAFENGWDSALQRNTSVLVAKRLDLNDQVESDINNLWLENRKLHAEYLKLADEKTPDDEIVQIGLWSIDFAFLGANTYAFLYVTPERGQLRKEPYCGWMGVAVCNPKDEYDRETGKRVALRRACDMAGLPDIYHTYRRLYPTSPHVFTLEKLLASLQPFEVDDDV